MCGGGQSAADESPVIASDVGTKKYESDEEKSTFQSENALPSPVEGGIKPYQKNPCSCIIIPVGCCLSLATT
jgi:hypothetical protein